jgi:Glycosyl hydrolases family 16
MHVQRRHPHFGLLFLFGAQLATVVGCNSLNTLSTDAGGATGSDAGSSGPGSVGVDASRGSSFGVDASQSGPFGTDASHTGTVGMDASQSGPGSIVDAAPLPPIDAAQYSLTVVTPTAGATVSGSVVVSGYAPGFVNVEVWDATHTSPPLGRATPAADGTFSATVGTTALANGSDAWTVWAWDVPAGQTADHSSSQPLTVTVANGGSGTGTGTGTGSSGAEAGGGGSGTVMPFGNIPGTWTLAFDDEFNGTSLDTTKWTPENGGTTNNVTTSSSNVAVTGGNLVLTLVSSSSGAVVCTGSSCCPAAGGCFAAGAGSYDLPVGGYAEARISFPGDGTQIYNWPAWWTFGPNWPAGGENDIAEGCGTLTCNYHSPAGALNHQIPGTWSNAFHVYGLHRMATSADVYWDGNLVVSYQTQDDGAPQSITLNVGDGCGGTPQYGSGSQVLVDYVRAWQ